MRSPWPKEAAWEIPARTWRSWGSSPSPSSWASRSSSWTTSPKRGGLTSSEGGTHWLRGFYLSKVVLEADVVIQTCCLKTHGFGGHFTMSLKNSVGLVAKKMPGGVYDYM